MLNTKPRTYNTLYLDTLNQAIAKWCYVFCTWPTAGGNIQQTEKARFSRSLDRIRCKLAAESETAWCIPPPTQQSLLIHPKVLMRRNIIFHLWKTRDDRHCSDIADAVRRIWMETLQAACNMLAAVFKEVCMNIMSSPYNTSCITVSLVT